MIPVRRTSDRHHANPPREPDPAKPGHHLNVTRSSAQPLIDLLTDTTSATGKLVSAMFLGGAAILLAAVAIAPTPGADSFEGRS